MTGRGRAEKCRRLGREKDVELQACLLTQPATFLHPESQEMWGVVWGRAFPDRSRHSEQYGGKNRPRSTEVRARAAQRMESGLIRFVDFVQ